MAKVRGKLPTDFAFGIEIERAINKSVISVISEQMALDHHFCMNDRGKIQFFPILDTDEPMVFTTTLNAIIDYEMESGPENADVIIKTLEIALRRAKKAARRK